MNIRENIRNYPYSFIQSLYIADRADVNKFMVCSFKTDTDRDFPGSAVVKNPPANAGDTGLSPGPGRSHMLQSN